MERKVKMQKQGRKEEDFFSVHGMVEKKENGIWEKDTAEVQFLGPFRCEYIVNPSQLFAQQVIKICSTCLESLKASEEAVQVGLPIATSDK